MSVSLPSLWALRGRGPGSLGLASETCSPGCPGHLPWHLGKPGASGGGGGGSGSAGWLSTGDNGPLWSTREGAAPGQPLVSSFRRLESPQT